MTRGDGSTIGFSYDGAGRPSTMTILRGATQFAYDAAGRLQNITAPDGGTTSYGYAGTLPSQVTWAGPVSASINFGYDTNLRITSESVACATSLLAPCQPVSFVYDSDGLPTQAGLMTLTWDTAKPLLNSTSANTLGQSFTYNQHGELLTESATAGGTPFFTEELTRDLGGRITTRTETIEGVAKTFDYGYDTAGRLSTVKANGSLTATYTYDSNGNRLTKVTPSATENGSYDDQDRLVTYNGSSYAFNGAGDLQSVTSSAGTMSTTYDALGNLTSVHLANGDTIDYVIDGQNRRIAKKRNGVIERRWIWRDALRIAAELDGSGNVISRFVYATGGNAPDLMIRNDETYELVKDHLGSVRVVIGTADGAVVQQLDYDEFGNVLNDTAPGFQPFGFAGGLYDPDTKLVRFGARDYDAGVGRWTAKDPIGFNSGDSNAYAYASNEPTTVLDPNGLSGVLTIYSESNSASSAPVWDGHSFVVFTPDGGAPTSYGLYGPFVQAPRGLNENWEMNHWNDYANRTGDYDVVSRTEWIDDAREQALRKVIAQYQGMGQDAWTASRTCSTFASDAWSAGTGERLVTQKNGDSYPNPQTLGQSIVQANGGIGARVVRTQK